eukprot:Platyproteum_vivax@DN1444_c0_g1_i1.p1
MLCGRKKNAVVNWLGSGYKLNADKRMRVGRGNNCKDFLVNSSEISSASDALRLLVEESGDGHIFLPDDNPHQFGILLKLVRNDYKRECFHKMFADMTEIVDVFKLAQKYDLEDICHTIRQMVANSPPQFLTFCQIRLANIEIEPKPMWTKQNMDTICEVFLRVLLALQQPGSSKMPRTVNSIEKSASTPSVLMKVPKCFSKLSINSTAVSRTVSNVSCEKGIEAACVDFDECLDEFHPFIREIVAGHIGDYLHHRSLGLLHHPNLKVATSGEVSSWGS